MTVNNKNNPVPRKDVKLRCSVGVMAHNEAGNIGFLLERLISQNLQEVVISEIIVVSSGCTDRTDEIVNEHTGDHKLVKLISEKERRGKASAINIFIEQSAEELLVIVGADTIPDHDAVEQLVISFADPLVGMSGARPVPLNRKDNLPGYIVHFLWELHHQLATRLPKCGEMVAFRKVFDALPPDTIVDEPQIEALVMKQGLKVVYEPAAVVYNLGPSTVGEIIMRRRSIVSGYVRLSQRTNYRVSTQRLRWWLIGFVLKRIFRGEEPVLDAICAIAVELISRSLGIWDAHFSRRPLHIWEPAASTKLPLEVCDAGKAQD